MRERADDARLLKTSRYDPAILEQLEPYVTAADESRPARAVTSLEALPVPTA